MKKTITVITLLLLFLGVHQLAAASAATLSFSPSQTTVEQGKDFTVTISVNTGTIYANAVGLSISYPKDKLEARSIGTSGSVLTIFAEKEISDGLVKISGGTPTPGFLGQKTIASISFRAKVASGSAQIKFAEGTVVLKDSDNTNFLDLNNSGIATISFKSPSTTPPPATQDTQAPILSEITIKDVTKDSVTISWQTDENSDSQIEYGLTSGQYNLIWTDAAATKEHLAIISNLPAAETFYFVVSSKDAAGNVAKSSEQTFSLLSSEVPVKSKGPSFNPGVYVGLGISVVLFIVLLLILIKIIKRSINKNKPFGEI